MKRLSTLDTFLAHQYSEGKRDSEGFFTLSAERALGKIAENALPFDSAWVLKTIQAAVAARFAEIRVSVMAGCTEIELSGPCPWTPEEIGYQLQVLDAATAPGLNHLVAALRDRLREERKLLFLFGGSRAALYWDGEELKSHEVEEIPEHTVLSVQTGSGSMGLDPTTISIVGSQNALIAQTITDNAFLCPVPLYLDSRRIDQLDHVVQDGPAFDVPVARGWVEESERALTLSGRSEGTTPETLPESFQTYLKEAELKGRRGLPWVVRAHFKSEEVTHQDRVMKIWDTARGVSTLNFVHDGVLVDQLPLLETPLHLSLHLFLSAKGLQHDLTGFALVENRQRQAAVEFGRRMAIQLVREQPALELPEDSAFPTTSWGTWLLRYFGAINDERLPSPASQLEKIELAYAALRENLLQLSSS